MAFLGEIIAYTRYAPVDRECYFEYEEAISSGGLYTVETRRGVT